MRANSQSESVYSDKRDLSSNSLSVGISLGDSRQMNWCGMQILNTATIHIRNSLTKWKEPISFILCGTQDALYSLHRIFTIMLNEKTKKNQQKNKKEIFKEI